MYSHNTKFLLFLLFCFLQNNVTYAYQGCDTTNFTNAYGPFDYTNKPEYIKNVRIVEAYHFSEDYERIIINNNGNDLLPRNIMKDLDYTLRACPNHHRALYAVASYMTFLKKRKTDKYNWLLKKYRTPECYFERAAAYSKKDYKPYLIYGMHLYKKGEIKESIKMLNKSLSRTKEEHTNYSELYYTLGLVYLKDKKYDDSLKYAKKAYALGYPFPFLKKKLTEMGKWKN